MKKVFVVFVFSCCIYLNQLVAGELFFGLPYLQKASEIPSLIPDNPEEIRIQVDRKAMEFQKELTAILSITKEERSFINTVRAYDFAVGNLLVLSSFYEGMSLVHPREDIREAANKAQADLNELFFNMVADHPKIYDAILEVKNKNLALQPYEVYYLNELLEEFQRLGCHLDLEKRKEVSKLQNAITDLSFAFQKNIQDDVKDLWVPLKDLEGLSEEFVASLEKDLDDKCRVTLDYPTYFFVMRNCSTESTRKELFQLFNSRAYPKNLAVITSLIEKRDELAQCLGFSSFADYDLQGQMAKKVKKVEEFLSSISKAAKKKAEAEFQSMIKTLPKGVSLTEDGKLKAYDVAFVANQYKKEQFFLDEQKIAEYFPLNKVLEGLSFVYGSFFGLKIQATEMTLWNQSLKVLEITKQDSNALLGYVILDLFPRANKYTHACECMLIPPYQEGEKKYPALSLVVTNFPLPIPSKKPSLLTHEQARTLFHEFGHAIHEILGSSDLITLCGARVKTDFVELPSQLLEEWLWDPSILKKITSHYITGEPLPDAQITQMLKAKNAESGFWVQRQCFLAQFSLECFKEGSLKDPIKLSQEVKKVFLGSYFLEEENFFPLSFGHLDGYASKYYGYLWSKVFALDVFTQIKKDGILNPKAGSRYVDSIIGRGGTKDPEEMLREFLGRDPSLDHFIESLGI